MSEWKNRIVGHGSKPADQFLAHPENWRTHPQHQRDAVQGSLNELGWIDTVIENVTTGNLIDGHERVWQALKNDNEEVPYIQVELSEEEERLALAILDPITEMANADREKLGALLQRVQSADEGVQSLLAGLAEREGVFFDEGADGQDRDNGGAGDSLSLLDITIEDPRHEVEKGQVWTLGDHVLICEEVLTGWQQWVKYLRPGDIFAPFPGPFVPLTVKAEMNRIVMVQPNTYIAGHIIDRWVDVNGDEEVSVD